MPREKYVVLDLAGEWLEMTGLPFVFAVWAARDEVATAELIAPFTESFETGLAELDAIVAETAAESGLQPAILRDYFTRNLRYRMGPAEQAGLAEFLRRALTHAAPLSRPGDLAWLLAAATPFLEAPISSAGSVTRMSCGWHPCPS